MEIIIWVTYPNPNIKEPKKLIDMDDLEVLESSSPHMLQIIRENKNKIIGSYGQNLRELYHIHLVNRV